MVPPAKPWDFMLWAIIVLSGVGAGEAADSTALRAMFADPHRQYSSAPLWVWNDMLSEEQVRGTLRDLAGQNVKQVFIHPRPGLMTPYLSADWFRLWKVALQEAQRLDMNVWIYDEDSYPSGFAGGLVPAAPLKLGKWNQQGLPLYGGAVAYRQKFELPQPSGRYVVRLPAWYGSVAEVLVNDRPAGYIGFAPWQCDVTEHVVAGVNTIEVRVIGTLKNTLGPHHAGTLVGMAKPILFHAAPQPGPPPGGEGTARQAE